MNCKDTYESIHSTLAKVKKINEKYVDRKIIEENEFKIMNLY